MHSDQRALIYSTLLCLKQVDVKRAVHTCAECDEKQLNLLAFWEQLNEVKLERDHVDALLRDQMFSCTHT